MQKKTSFCIIKMFLLNRYSKKLNSIPLNNLKTLLMKKLDGFLTRVILQSLFFLSISLIGFSQARTVTGRVTDSETKTGMGGVSVTVKGTNVATQTQNDGSYSISVPEGARNLVFSFVGYS